MSVTAQNLEEAATIASEFISSLDNLPGEVNYLLQEMKHKDSRAQEIQQELTKESSKYVRHALRHPSLPPSPAVGSGAVNGAHAVTTNGNAVGDHEEANGETSGGNSVSNKGALTRIEADHMELAKLADERVELATRIVTLITRTRTRLEGDLVRVGVLQGEVVLGGVGAGGIGGGSGSGVVGIGSAAGSMNGVGYGGAGSDVYVLHGRNPAVAISESLRHALSGGGGDVAVGTQKKRRLGTQTSIKLPITAAAGSGGNYGRSRLSRQIHPTRSADEDEGDADAEGEEDAEGEDVEEGEGDEGDDHEIYCFCRKLSYGEMIACDNVDCPYQWFHLPCVGLKPPLPDRWYCSECIGKFTGQETSTTTGGTGRKGRKK